MLVVVRTVLRVVGIVAVVSHGLGIAKRPLWYSRKGLAETEMEIESVMVP
jgi:hypothetical protein